MYKDYRYINAGENEIYRWGKKTIEEISQFLEPNDKGYISIPTNGGKAWTIGTSTGKYGEFCKFKDTFFSVNSWGYAYAKAGTEKGDKLVEFIQSMIEEMHLLHRGDNNNEE